MSTTRETMGGLRLMNDAEVAQVYGVTRQTVWKWSKAKRIPAPRKDAGGRLRWLSSDVFEHLDSLQQAQLEEAAT